MQETSLKKRYSVKLFTNIILGVVNAILISIVPKALGPVAYGQFIYLQEFFTQAIGLLDMGSSMAFFTKLSARNERKELITFYFFYSFFILCLIVGFVYVNHILGFINYFVPGIPIEYIYMGLVFSFFTWFTQIFIKISDAYALTVSVELIKIGHKIISLLILLFFIYQLTFDIELYYYFNYISLVSFLFITSWLFIKKDIFKNILSIKLPIMNLIKEFVLYCHPLLIYSIVLLISGFFDIWLLQRQAGSEQTGFYGLSYSIVAVCFLFANSMTSLIIREFSKSYEQRNLENMRKLFCKYTPMLYSISAYFAVFISFQSENVLMIFVDENFQGAFIVLVIMAFYPIHQTYGQLGGSIFYATGNTNLLKNIVLFITPISIILTFVFIYILNLGALGLASKMIIIQFLGVNVQLYFNAKILKFNIAYFIWHQIYSLLFFICLAFISSFLFNDIFYLRLPLLEFLLSGLFYTVLVIIFTYIFPQIFATSRDEIRANLTKVRRYVIKK